MLQTKEKEAKLQKDYQTKIDGFKYEVMEAKSRFEKKIEDLGRQMRGKYTPKFIFTIFNRQHQGK